MPLLMNFRFPSIKLSYSVYSATYWNNIRYSETIIDNTADAISGNLTAMISDHLPEIVIVPNVFANTPSNRSNIYERGWSNFDQVNFVLDYFSIDWNDPLKINEENIDYSTEVFLNKISNLLDCYAPLKKSADNDVTISDSCDIANTFNNYFSSIAKKTKDNINYSHKHYSDYLSDKCKNSFFIHPTNKDEIADIISSLDKNKSVGPYSIPNNILILLKMKSCRSF